MAQDYTWMMAMHRVATRFGAGLKPELAALLSQTQTDGNTFVNLPVRLKSSGPARQFGDPCCINGTSILPLNPPKISVGPSVGDPLLQVKT